MILARWTTMRIAFALPGAPVPTPPDGGLYLPEFPQDHVGINGFDASLFITPAPFAFPATITCNGGQTDAEVGTTYHWWLSQRTDDETRQVLALAQPDRDNSGTVVLSTTSLASRLLPGVDPAAYAEDDQLGLLLRHTWLYIQRQSDKAIQVVDLLAEVTQ